MKIVRERYSRLNWPEDLLRELSDCESRLILPTTSDTASSVVSCSEMEPLSSGHDREPLTFSNVSAGELDISSWDQNV